MRLFILLFFLCFGFANSEPDPVTYKVSGRASAFLFSQRRDRTITFTPKIADKKIQGVDVLITDHANGGKETTGALEMVEGVFVATRVEMVNARNILTFTPRILEMLEKSAIEIQGFVEVRGKVYEVEAMHRILKRHEDGRLEIETVVRSPKIRTNTLTVLGPDKLPISAVTSGTIEMALRVKIRMNLERVAPEPGSPE